MANKLGALIKEARAENGWTQEQLAKKVKGLSASDIGRIERGEKIPETEQIKLIAKALGVTQTSLLNAAKGTGGKGGSAKTGSAKTGSAKTSSAKTGTGKSSSKTGGKTSSAKSGSGKSSSSAKTSGTSVTVTAAEKKLLQQYRKADDMTREAVDKILAAAAPASGKSDAGGDLLNSLLGSVLKQLMG